MLDIPTYSHVRGATLSLREILQTFDSVTLNAQHLVMLDAYTGATGNPSFGRVGWHLARSEAIAEIVELLL